MTKLIKEDAYKSKEEVDSLIMKMEAQDISEQATPAPMSFVPVQKEGALVPDDFYTGALFPMISNYLPEGMELTPVEQVQLTKGVQRKLTGLSASVPIKCYGESCPFKRQCPLYVMGKAPVDLDCPIESMVMDLYTKRYLDEFEVSANDFSEVTTMSMLAATHIMEMRAFMSLGQDDNNSEVTGSPDGLIKNVVGFNNDDEPIVQIQEHPAYNIIERAWRWRTKLLESLGATRKEKQKNNSGELLDSSIASKSAELKSMIQKITTVDISG